MSTLETTNLKNRSSSVNNIELGVDGSSTVYRTVLPSGSSADPTLRFSGDSNTGIYSAGLDVLAIAASGVESVRFTQSGANISGVLTVGGQTTLGSTVSVPLGSSGLPSLSFVSDPNTGIYSPGADQVAISTNGIDRVEFGTSEVVFNDDGVDVDFRVEGDTKTNLFKVDAGTDAVSVDGAFSVTGDTTVVRSYSAPIALTDAATVETNLALSNHFTLTLGGNRTLGDPTNKQNGQSGLIIVKQDGTGSRTLAYNSVWKFPGGVAPSLTTTANATDILAYFVESSTRINVNLVKGLA
jgi:hypothetical protein